MKKETNKIAGHTVMSRDIGEKKRTEVFQQITFNIAKLCAKKIVDIRGLAEFIHLELDKIMNVQNFYIALHDKKNNCLEFPYITGGIKQTKNYTKRKYGNGITEYIIETGKPVLLDVNAIKGLATTGKIKLYDKMPEILMGIPLKSARNTMGAMVVQSYTNPAEYTEKDLLFMKPISDLIGNVLLREKITSELMNSEEYFRAISEKSYNVISILNKKKIIEYESPSAKIIYGYNPQTLYGKIFMDFIHPDEKNSFNDSMEKLIKRKNTMRIDVCRFLHSDGSWKVVEMTSKNLLDDKVVNGILIHQRDITLQNQHEVELIRINKELDTFVYKVSHDFKSPLATTLGLINMSKGEVKDETANWYLRLIENSINHLDDILKDLEEITVIRKGKVKYTTTDIETLVTNIIHSFAHNPDIKDVKFNVKNDLKEKVKTDVAMIKTVLRNLIENAIKYRDSNKKNTTINVHISKSENLLMIDIKDNGIGISPKYQETIFEMFFRGTNLSKGSGLGLYMVKSAVEKLGGAITLKSKENSGSTFSIRLPLKF